ncbi:MAG: GTP cyclohydrolase MptA [Promethearchaeota archaeon]
MSKFKVDLQASKTEFHIGIDKVGLEDVKKRIEIARKDGHYSINLTINAFINLPERQRGAHMSRTAESIDECITEHLYSPYNSVEEFGLKIAKSLLVKHAYANKCNVEMEGPLIIQTRKDDTKASTQAAYYLKCIINGFRANDDGINDKFDIYLGVEAEGMIACPCGQEMSREFAEEIISNRKDLNLDKEKLEDILNLIPIATHNQRARGTLLIQLPEPGAIDLMEIIYTIENSMSGKIAGILKRPDEANLIRVVHQDPLFTEDVLRRMAYFVASEKFLALPDSMEVNLKVLSFESIHPHQCSAEAMTTLGALRKAKIELK